jgi:hypothetical protein
MFSGILRPPQDLRVSNSFTVAPTFFDGSASSTYHSLQIEVRRRYRSRLAFGSALTYSHAIDDASDLFDSEGSFALPQDSRAPSERGASNFDLRLRSVSHFVWSMPGSNRWVRNFRLSGIVTAQSGPPYTINTAVDLNRDGNLTDRARVAVDTRNPGWIRALASQGMIGRNTARTPGMASLDAALARDLHVREHWTLQLRGEAFNLLNRTNAGIPVRILEMPGFGNPVATTTPARTVQLLLKVSF